MTDDPTGFRFPTSRIPYRDRPGLGVWPDGARMAFLFYGSAEQWHWGKEAQSLDPYPLARFGEKRLALSMRSAIEYGFNVGLHRTMEVLQDLGLTSTFWTTGNAIEQHRDVVELLAQEGHELGRTATARAGRMVGNLNDVPLLTQAGKMRSVEDAGRYLRESFDASYEQAATTPLVLNFGTHPHIIGRPDACKVMRRFLEYAVAHEDVWFCTYGEMAAWWQEQFGRLVPEGGGDLDVTAVAKRVR